MFFSLIIRLLLGVMVAVISAPLIAAQAIKVIDQAGNPLKDAVIFVAGPSAKANPHQPAVMDQINKRFVPHVLTVPVGQQVEFPNSDDIRHHVYSFSEPKTFELKLYSGKPETPITFDNPGIVVLGCNIHDSMVGYIVVSHTHWWGQTDATGFAHLGNLTEAPHVIKELSIWHPHLADQTKAFTKMQAPTPNANNTSVITLNVKAPKTEEPTFKRNRFHRYGR